MGFNSGFKGLMCHTEQCGQFSHVIWTCTALLQSSYPGSWPPNRKSTVLQFVKSFVSMPWMTHPSCRGSSLGTRVGSTCMIPRLNNSLRNGRTQDPPKPEEGEADLQSDQEHAHRVFRHSRECAPWICPRRPDREPRVILQCSSSWGRTFGENDLNCGARAIGCSMMTMHPLTELS